MFFKKFLLITTKQKHYIFKGRNKYHDDELEFVPKTKNRAGETFLTVEGPKK